MDPPPILKLHLIQGPIEGEIREFQPRCRVRIGRVARGNNLTIKDSGISSKHLSIASESGKWVIQDLNSSNGTILNAIKIPANTPLDLSHGDLLKIGECTSIKVEFVAHKDDAAEEEPNLQRNTGRRGGLNKDRALDAKEETVEEGRENGVGNKRSFRQREAKILENEDAGNLEEEMVNLTKDPENENAAENKRKLRQRKVRAVKHEDAENLDKEMVNVEGKKETKACPRRTRSKKNEHDLVSDVKINNVSEISGLVKGEVGIEGGRTRAGVRRARNNAKKDADDLKILEVAEKSVDAPVDTANNVGLSLRENANSHLRKDVGTNNEDGVAEQNLADVDKNEENPETLDIRGKDLKASCAKALNLGEDNNEGVAGGSGLEEAVNKVAQRSGTVVNVNSDEKSKNSVPGEQEKLGNDCQSLDIEKMTLGEWFDYLELYLPGQITDLTEEMIVSMRQKAWDIRVYIEQQKHEKRKVSGGDHCFFWYESTINADQIPWL